MFNNTQVVRKRIASWSRWIDTTPSRIREAAVRICGEDEVMGPWIGEALG